MPRRSAPLPRLLAGVLSLALVGGAAAALVDERAVGGGVTATRFTADFGALRPGEVVNIMPQRNSSDTRAFLERPAPHLDILVHGVGMDIVDGATNETLPLDTLYVHHFVLFTAPNPSSITEAAAARTDTWRCHQDPEACAAYGRRYSLNLGPCAGDGETRALAWGGGGAEFRGPQKRANASGDLRWAEPAGTLWSTNMHLIDLRNVSSVRDAVQCNCDSYSNLSDAVEPGPGGGIQCCPDGTRSRTAFDDGTAPREEAPTRDVRFVYTVYWTPLDEANATHLHHASFPVSAGSSGCGYQYNARADCDPASEAAGYLEGAPPTNQTCAPGGKETVAVGRSFSVPENVTWNVHHFDGHLHVGGLRLSLVVDGDVVCESRPTYGTVEGAPGNEKGFLVDMSGCQGFELQGGSTFHVEAVYSAEVAPDLIAWGVPYEGVMGYAQFSILATPPDGSSEAGIVIAGQEQAGEGVAPAGCAAQLTDGAVAAMAEKLESSVVLRDKSPGPKLELLWDAAGSANVSLALRTDQQSGWFAVGFHNGVENHGMAGADMIVARLREGGVVDVEERSSDGFITPTLKAAGVGLADCAAERGAGGATEVRVVRPLRTEQRDGVNITKGERATVIWAFSLDEDFSYHGPTARGHVDIAW